MRLGISSHAFRWAAGWCDLVRDERMGTRRFLEEPPSLPGGEGVQVCDNLHRERLAEPRGLPGGPVDPCVAPRASEREVREA